MSASQTVPDDDDDDGDDGGDDGGGDDDDKNYDDTVKLTSKLNNYTKCQLHNMAQTTKTRHFAAQELAQQHSRIAEHLTRTLGNKVLAEL